jgi:hypothetical protein
MSRGGRSKSGSVLSALRISRFIHVLKASPLPMCRSGQEMGPSFINPVLPLDFWVKQGVIILP